MIAEQILKSGFRLFGIVALAFSFGTLPSTTSAQTTPKASPIKIGVIGSGNIGGTIGGLWVQAGHPVLFSSRHPEELTKMTADLGPLAKLGTVGDVILLAVPYKAVPQLSKDYGPKFAGKVVLDADNAVAARDGDELLKET